MYPRHEILYEAKLKSNGLITLVEEISRQHNGESVEGLLLVIFMHIYNEKKQQIGQKEIKKNVQFGEKKNTRRPKTAVSHMRKMKY